MNATFYQRARVIMQQLDQASEALIEQDEELCGLLRIAAPMTFGIKYLGRILLAFISHHPQLALALELNDQLVDLSSEGYDLGICIGRLCDSSFVARKLAKSRRIVCCSPAYAHVLAYLPRLMRSSAMRVHRLNQCISRSNLAIRASKTHWRPALIGCSQPDCHQ